MVETPEATIVTVVGMGLNDGAVRVFNPESCRVRFRLGAVRVFRRDLALEDAIGSHAFAPLEALPCM
jgi:hypothetical protein